METGKIPLKHSSRVRPSHSRKAGLKKFVEIRRWMRVVLNCVLDLEVSLRIAQGTPYVPSALL